MLALRFELRGQDETAFGAPDGDSQSDDRLRLKTPPQATRSISALFLPLLAIFRMERHENPVAQADAVGTGQKRKRQVRQPRASVACESCRIRKAKACFDVVTSPDCVLMRCSVMSLHRAPVVSVSVCSCVWKILLIDFG